MCIKHVCIKFNFNLLFKLHRKPWNCDTYSGIEINKFMFFIFMFLSFFFCHYILRKLNISLHTHHTVSFLNSASLCRRWSAFSCFLSSFLDLDATFRANSLCFSSLSLYKKIIIQKWLILFGSIATLKLLLFLLLELSNASSLTSSKVNTHKWQYTSK